MYLSLNHRSICLDISTFYFCHLIWRCNSSASSYGCHAGNKSSSGHCATVRRFNLGPRDGHQPTVAWPLRAGTLKRFHSAPTEAKSFHLPPQLFGPKLYGPTQEHTG